MLAYLCTVTADHFDISFLRRTEMNLHTDTKLYNEADQHKNVD